MESFHWDPNFEVGIADVDSQHKQLVDIINALATCTTENRTGDVDLDGLFSQLADYAVYHFREEEQMMREVGVHPRHLEVHLSAHRAFLREVEVLTGEASPDEPATLEHLSSFLVHWLGYHILGSDKNMARQVAAIQRGRTPEEAFREGEQSKDSATAPLVGALDNLFHLISARNRELSELNRTLEAKVAERTAELVEANAHLETMALTDALTGLPNRRAAMQTLQAHWQESSELGLPLACIMIDADHFKEVNDTYGHDAGDDVLVEVARTLKHNLRNDDLLARLGGDEFFVVCPKTDAAGVLHVGQILQEKIAALRVPTGDGAWKGSISVGVAARTPSHSQFEALIKSADEGVYAAKRAGKNCVRTAEDAGE